MSPFREPERSMPSPGARHTPEATSNTGAYPRLFTSLAGLRVDIYALVRFRISVLCVSELMLPHFDHARNAKSQALLGGLLLDVTLLGAGLFPIHDQPDRPQHLILELNR